MGKLAQIAGAKRYAQADRSDPFAFSRAVSHINNGICKPYLHEKRRVMIDCDYDARGTTETRELIDGVLFSDGTTAFKVVEWRGRVRP